jgi:hypothetical protein
VEEKMHRVVPVIEALEGRALLSASPDVIAADRAELLANKAALQQAVQEKTATLSADRKALVSSLLSKAREAGLLRRDLIKTALAQWRVIAQHQREHRATLQAIKTQIQAEQKALLASGGDAQQQAIHRANLETLRGQQADAQAAKRATLLADLANVRQAFRSVEPQVKQFLQSAKTEIDALRDQIAQKNQFYADLIDEYRAKVLASQQKLNADLRA